MVKRRAFLRPSMYIYFSGNVRRFHNSNDNGVVRFRNSSH